MSYSDGLSQIIREKLDRGKEVSVLPKGNSMLPLIRGDLDRVYLEKVDEKDIKIGDIVLFLINDSTVLHRVVSIESNDFLKLKGDGNYTIEYCSFKDVIARVKYIERGSCIIYKDSFLWKIYNLLWPKNNFFRHFFLFLYKL